MTSKLLFRGVLLVFLAGVGLSGRAFGAAEGDKPSTATAAAKPAPKKSTTASAASETTLKGEMTCAKCGLHESAKCQNVLRVKDAAGKETKYYLQKNTVSENEHEKVCGGSAPATVTGKVSDEGGKKVLTATSVKFD